MTAREPTTGVWIAVAAGIVAWLLSWSIFAGFWIALIIGVIVAVVVWVYLQSQQSVGKASSTAHSGPVARPASPSPRSGSGAASGSATASGSARAGGASTGSGAAAPAAPASAAPTTASPTRSAGASGAAPASPAAAAPPPAAPDAPAAARAAAPTEAGKPQGLSAARGGQPDDLKKIKGVGPKLEQLLNSMGFYHYDQIAAWSASEIAWVDENLQGFKGRVTRDEWVSQARTLAEGGSTEFSRRN